MDDREQIRQDWSQHETALFECAQAAWQAAGGYELCGWQAHSLAAVVGYGYPPQARREYQHVFLFERHQDGYHLRTVGKAPSDRSIGWFGVCLTARSTFIRCYPTGAWIADSRFSIPGAH